MEDELNEITDDVIGCDLNDMDLDKNLEVSVRDLKEMLEEAYRAGHRAGVTTGY